MIIGLIIICGSIAVALGIYHFLTIVPLDPPWGDERRTPDETNKGDAA